MTTTETKKEYNGWKNVDTWQAILWATNDEDDYNQARDMAMGPNTPEFKIAYIKSMVMEISKHSNDNINPAIVDWPAIVSALGSP